MSKKAKISLKDRWGTVPLKDAERENYEDIVSFFKQKMLRVNA